MCGFSDVKYTKLGFYQCSVCKKIMEDGWEYQLSKGQKESIEKLNDDRRRSN